MKGIFIVLFFQFIGFAFTSYSKIGFRWNWKAIKTNEDYPENFLCSIDGLGCSDNGCNRAGGRCFSTSTPPQHSCFCTFKSDDQPEETVPEFMSQLDNYSCVFILALAFSTGMLAAALSIWCFLRCRNSAKTSNEAVRLASNDYEKMKNEDDDCIA